MTWSGHFVEAKPSEDSYFIGSDHALTLFVKMDPSESLLHPDLVLSVSSGLYNKDKDMIDGVRKGDEIKFTAKLVSIGNEFKMHHLQALSVEQTGGHKELSEIRVKESALSN